ncbi:hypothetical protein [Nibrella saemangeumensis]
MKKVLAFIVSVSFLLSGHGCRDNQKADTTTESAATSAGGASDTPISERLQSLGLTGEGHWRGISLGDSLAIVKNTEEAKLFESDASHLGYSLEFPNMESVDMLYHQKDQKVLAIDVDLYLNTRQSVTDYTNDLKQYFTARYGHPVQQEKAVVWTGTQQEKISVIDVSEGKDYGIKIKINSALEAAATASTRR